MVFLDLIKKKINKKEVEFYNVRDCFEPVSSQQRQFYSATATQCGERSAHLVYIVACANVMTCAITAYYVYNNDYNTCRHYERGKYYV